MHSLTARWLFLFAPATAAIVFTTSSAAAAEPRPLTAPAGSTKGSALLPHLEQENVAGKARVR